MEKQRIENCPKKRYRIIRRIFYGLAVIIGVGIIFGLFFWRNPFWIPEVDASSQTASLSVEEGWDYVRVSHMDLSFTGFYTVDTGDEICGYYYIGAIGDQSWFVEIKAQSDDAGLSQAMPDLTDMTFVAQISEGTSVLSKAADSEGMTEETYLETYNISDSVLMTYGTHREADMLYYGIAFLVLLGCLVAGRLFIHETQN
jgi:hypothetical protein